MYQHTHSYASLCESVYIFFCFIFPKLFLAEFAWEQRQSFCICVAHILARSSQMYTYISQNFVEIVSIFSGKCSLVDDKLFSGLSIYYFIGFVSTVIWIQYRKCCTSSLRSHEVTTQIYCIATEACKRTHVHTHTGYI